MIAWSLLLAPLLAATASAQDRACNSSPALCSRAYSNVTFMGAHDSPFVRELSNGFSISGDQFYDSFKQLDSGVRLLTAQIHSSDNDYHLCHTACALLDAGPVTDWLSKLKTWLDNHPNDVVTILLVNSDNLDAEILNGLWTKAGIVDYGYAPSDTSKPQAEWPTLGEMIDSGKRLVTFIPDLKPADNAIAPYLLDEFTFAFENTYHNDKASDFNCDIDRPDNLKAGGYASAISAGYLPLMNHFRYDAIGAIEIPSVENVEQTNSDGNDIGNLGNSANNCTSLYGRAPAYILADFVNVGPALDTADRLNGIVGNVQGRTSLPNTVLGSVISPAGSNSTSGAVSSSVTNSASPVPCPTASGASCTTTAAESSATSTATSPADVTSNTSQAPTNAPSAQPQSSAPTSTSVGRAAPAAPSVAPARAMAALLAPACLRVLGLVV